jgi:hypothetical protein
MVEKYITPTHLSEYLITFLSMDIVIYNYVFSEDHMSILHALPPLVVKLTCVLQVIFLFSKLVTLDFDMWFL